MHSLWELVKEKSSVLDGTTFEHLSSEFSTTPIIVTDLEVMIETRQYNIDISTPEQEVLLSQTEHIFEVLTEPIDIGVVDPETTLTVQTQELTIED